eukprot:403349140
MKKIFSAVIGTANREYNNIQKREISPGPKYLPKVDSSKRRGNNYSFSNGSTRKIFVPKFESPGPGQYQDILNDFQTLKQLQKQKQRSKSTIKNSRNIIELLHQPTPGPLDYSPDNQKILKHQPQCVIGTAKQRQDLAGKSQLESPSPDRYETRTKIQKRDKVFNLEERFRKIKQLK